MTRQFERIRQRHFWSAGPANGFHAPAQ